MNGWIVDAHAQTEAEESMYTVLRFNGKEDQFASIGYELNSIIPNFYSGPDKVGERFSCSLATDDNWVEHGDSVEMRLRKLAAVIKRSHLIGFTCGIDVALEPEDYLKQWITELTFSVPLLTLLAELQISLAISIYGEGR